MTKKLITICAAAAMIVGCGQKSATTLTKSGLNPEDFNAERDGATTALYTLTNKAGMEVCITNFGGRIVSIMVPDRNGEFKDVVHGFSTVQDYFPENHKTDFGATIGRYANRINQGKITVDGVEYQLPQNNYGHCLHGGPNGWQYKVAEVVESDGSHVKLKFDSPDGEANFPGHVTAFVTFTLTEDNAIDINYEATTDKTTVINMTNHSYFNLSGDGNNSIEGNELYINASNFTPVDDTFMTTGEIVPVEGTPMDFRTAKKIGQDINADYDQLHNGKGYDHNWVLDTKGDQTALAAELYCPESGIVLKEYTNEPGVQVYVGNFLDGTNTGKRGVTYNFRTAVCLETQHYPDTPNKPEWPTALLKPGETYHSFCRFAFSTK
ncbi:MAG: galactose mutarotase [Bacteroidales bacterium]|jgi:aldose 1-epimerase|nr:galactose mutarotase [Bacteroidales bacterium]MBQ3978521.1 galactose mutarotase [Bacteroidales bacterium]